MLKNYTDSDKEEMKRCGGPPEDELAYIYTLSEIAKNFNCKLSYGPPPPALFSR